MKKERILLSIFFSILFPVTLFAQNNVPGWIFNIPVTQGTIYGIGSAKLSDSENALMLAEEKAIISAVRMASFVLEEMMQDKMYDNQKILDSESNVEIETRSITMGWNVSDIEVIRREQTSDGTWWCLAIYKRSLYSIINDLKIQ
jgi:hypothetical protein